MTAPYFARLARCDECGAEPRHACRDDDDLPVTRPCVGRGELRTANGRRLVTRDDDPSSTAQTRGRRDRAQLAEPVYVPCQCCGVPVRLWGAAVVTGVTWCSAPTCRLDRDRGKWRRYAAGRRKTVCSWCAAPLPPIGRGADAARPCCGEIECVRAIKREHAAKSRAAKP